MPRVLENIDNALVADATLAFVGMDRDGELTVRLKIALTEPFNLNVLRAWVHNNLRLYLVKPALGSGVDRAKTPF